MAGLAPLKAVGYWRPSDEMLRLLSRARAGGYGGAPPSAERIAARGERPPNPLPHPEALVRLGWNRAERPGILAYLRAGQEWIRYNGWSYCRFECGVAPRKLGDRDLTDGGGMGPEGLAHYVAKHSVHLPDEFVGHMRSRGWRVTAEPIVRWVDRERSDRPAVDFMPWIEWSRRMGASGPT